jgi:pyrroloquinoline quinone (PQQ) biosynthesis protein C
LDDLRLFMQHHVFAVWDFMSLLKALQRDLTCVTLPWVPRGNPATRRLINEIVLEEETDVDQHGQPASHFELYLRSMEECGADTQSIRRFLAALAAQDSVAVALQKAHVPDSVQNFVLSTFEIINLGQPHATAAAFTFGREDVIPDMFRHLVNDLNARFPGQLNTFTYYLNRHIELDEEVHTPLAQQMVRELCGDSTARWQQAQAVAVGCMQARVALWDGIQQAINESAAVAG